MGIENEIENGILRSNRSSMATLYMKPFSVSDPKMRIILPQVEPRIHFALNCGARSCPPIRVYTEDRIDSQLDTASRSFLDQEVSLIKDPVTDKWTLELSKLFLWYGEDFGN